MGDPNASGEKLWWLNLCSNSLTREIMCHEPSASAIAWSVVHVYSTIDLEYSEGCLTEMESMRTGENIFCPHCGIYVAIMTFWMHKRVYYDSDTDQWIKKDTGDMSE